MLLRIDIPYSRGNMEHIDFMAQAVELSKQSTCSRRSVAVLAVREQEILLTAYNSTVIPQKTCSSVQTCIRGDEPSGKRLEHCWAIHAEQALLLDALEKGISLKGCLIYCTTQPCSTCTKLLIGANVAGIYYSELYPTEFGNMLITEVQQHKKFIFEHLPYNKKRYQANFL